VKKHINKSPLYQFYNNLLPKVI